MREPNVDKSKLFGEIGYSPHSEEQQYIHDSDARFRIPCCGRRFGKSQAVGHEGTWKSFIPDAYIWVVGPNYALGEKEFRVIYDDLVRKLKVKGIRKSYNVKQGDMRIQMPWNTVIEVKTAEKQDGLVGEGLDHAIMSESALHYMSTWQQFIEPALADKQGSADFPSTPRGSNWYKGLYQLGRDPNMPDYESWRFPSWKNTKVFPGGFDPGCPNILMPLRKHFQGSSGKQCSCNNEMVRIFNQVSEHYWAQEYAAEFTSREGKIYKNWNEQEMVIDYEYNPSWPNYLTFDFGYSDPFCCYDIQVNPANQAVYIWREYQLRYKTTWDHANYLIKRENPDGYHVAWAAADPRGADEIATLQMVTPWSILHNQMGWALGVEAIDRAMKKREDGTRGFYMSRNCPELKRQIEDLQTPVSREGKNAREGQRDYDDHGPDAVRYFFNEYFVANAGGGLADVYSGGTGAKVSEAEAFFTTHIQTRLDVPIGYGGQRGYR
jgi:hypothetical protein